jgi:VWFA-related protein
MNKRRISWIVAYIAVMPTAMLLLGQAPSTPIMREPDRPASEAQESRIRRLVLSVNVPVTVMNAKGELVSNLEAKDFRVTDNGVPQKIMYLDLEPTPLSMVFLVETSSRIEPLLTEMRKTGIIFADALMGPNDEAAVVGFNDSVDDLAEFTNDHDIILTTISNLKCGMERSKLFDAMATGVNLLSTHLQRQSVGGLLERRLVIVAMSEATDVGSDGRLESVVRRAQLYNIAVYSVGIPTTLAQLKAPAKDVRHMITPEGIFPQPGMPGTVQISPTEDIRYGYGNLMNLNVWAARNVKDQIKGHALQIAAAQTGGRHIATFGGISMQKAVDEIGRELHTQYSLTYEPKGTDKAGYHKIKVYVKNKDLKVRARPGYYIAPPEN